ncbi:hypothetical protein F5B22DRAFT_662509 [Xylaria bambusicola]|uniref:uncharacterized protein n=1 Tax=Xylaria bambusicola TaxID=326684 RepID=UPI002008727D|nr:uncharacterized protein F5B22DRAFT_662509 [Xylaria bambusicola]KAI0521395.1 hypothetical protein F5B22DRAFT_662509 [Xylaria bambusicola]
MPPDNPPQRTGPDDVEFNKMLYPVILSTMNSTGTSFTKRPLVRTVNDISTWSELAKYITAFTPAAADEVPTLARAEVKLTCDICRTSHLRVPPWLAGNASFTDENSENICVLPCGHFFGYECMKTWTTRDIETAKQCPNCRYKLTHPVCGDLIKIPVIRDLDPNDPKSVTYVIPYTREHRLKRGELYTFEDVSTWDPALADREHNFGVTIACHDCGIAIAKNIFQIEWDRTLRW